MTQAPPPASPSPNPFQPPEPYVPAQRRSVVWWLAGGALAAVFCCSGLCLVPIGLAVYQAATQRDDVEQEINAFLVDLNARQFESCLAHFSPRSIRVASLSVEKMKQLADDPHFLASQAVHIAQTNVTFAANTNQDLPQGTVANVSGTVSYEGGDQGTFQAILEKEQGKWRINTLRINRNKLAPKSPEP